MATLASIKVLDNFSETLLAFCPLGLEHPASVDVSVSVYGDSPFASSHTSRKDVELLRFFEVES